MRDSMASTVVAKQRSVERLIASCEGLISGKGQFQGKDWKLSRYVIALRQQITELENNRSVDQDTLHMFLQKVSVLEEVVRSTPTEPTAQSLDASATDEASAGVSTSTPSLVRLSSLRDREELFSKSTDREDGLRHRGSAALASESPEAAMERHRRNQESIAQEMMGIARSLKENAKTAQNIITGDNKVLEKTNVQADQNITAVETQTDRVKDHNRGCPWGTILLLVVVFFVFIAMVLFIRIIPKPRTQVNPSA